MKYSLLKLSNGLPAPARRLMIILPMAAVMLFPSCRVDIPEKGTVDYADAVSAFYVGLVAVQVGNDPRAASELAKAAELAPGEPAVWNNLGVLQMRQKDSEEAAKSLETAAELAPEQALIYLNLGLLARQNGDSEAAAGNFKRVLELDPGNAKALYSLAVEDEKQQNTKQALESFRKILNRHPDNLAALVEAARLEAKLGDETKLGETLSAIEESSGDWPDEAKARLKEVKSAPVDEAATEIAFLRNLLLRVPGFRASIDAIRPLDTVLGELFLRPLVLEVPDFKPAEPDTGIAFAAEPFSDSAATAARIVFLDGETPVASYSTKTETVVGETEIPVSAARPGSTAVLDFDYDYRNDVAYAGDSGFKLFKQTADSKFEDVTANTGVSASVSGNSFSGVWAFDFDNEGDLDLLLSEKASAPVVLRNNGDGTFEELAPFENLGEFMDFEYADLDEDGDSDAVFLLKDGNVRVFDNERGGLFKPNAGFGLDNAGAVAIGDSDGDGIFDLNAISTDGSIYRLTDTGTSEVAASGFKKCGSGCRLFVSDIDNNGANDLIATDGSTTRLLLGKAEGPPAAAGNTINAAVTDVADLNGDGKLDLVGLSGEGKAVKLINRSTMNYNWQILRPKSVKSEGDQRINTFGIGGEMEIRSGLLAQKQLIRAPQVHFGLGTAESADVVRIIWQNGYVQAEFDLKPNQVVAAEQRLKGSCPHLFAWNGEEFAHVKDAPPWSPALGLKINAQDTYGILQTEEWFKIPGEALKPKDGFYELRITGEYWEAYYLDHYRLMAVDHPEGTEVFTDERFSIPLPPLEVFTTGIRRPFAAAVDHNGRDVSGVVRTLDEKYLDGFKFGKFQGVAEDHYVELELPEDAPLDEKLWIVADGWVHPTDASINVQRGQGIERPPRSLSIEIEDGNGGWKTAKDNLGFPAGKMKTILLDLEGVFAEGSKSRKLRLRTEMEVFWDRLAWATAEEGKSSQKSEIPIDFAELRYRGFSVIEKPNDSMPEVPDYDRILTTDQRWRDLEGYYTRFGDVKELLAKIDDRIVLANAGDELIMKFPALPPVKKGFKRDFVIIGNGWIKDGDLNSVFSRTVIPLPTQASNDYTRPPTRLEDDPVFQKNRRDWIDFHTRYVAPDRFRAALRVKR